MIESGTTYLALVNSKQWTRAVVIEAKEILQLHDSLIKLDRSFELKPQADSVFELLKIKEYYFTIALSKARKWLTEATEYDGNLQQVIDKIDHDLPNIRAVRNMKEHEIEYYKNEGRNQKDFIKEVDKENSGIEGKIVSDATSTVVLGDTYLVGGRLNVQQAIQTFSPLYELIEQKIQELWDKELEEG